MTGVQTCALPISGEVGDTEQMVEMAMRDEDRGALRTEPSERQPDLGRVTARVDDDGLARAGLGPDDVAVRPDRSERELIDAQRHGQQPSAPTPSVGLLTRGAALGRAIEEAIEEVAERDEDRDDQQGLRDRKSVV